MQSKQAIERRLGELKQEYGEWTYDIPLPFDIWTKGNLRVPHTRLKRILQNVSDFVQKPLSECRVLDLGCLDGMFSIECALHGAETIGIEIREANVRKAAFCKDVLGLDNLEFREDDARNISVESYGRFDAIICSGLLYHLPAPDVIRLIETMFEMVSRVMILDTHVALRRRKRFEHNGDEYWGCTFREHSAGDTQQEKAKRLWASWDNPTSFWFTRPSLVNILSKTGFSSVYECFVPAHINYGKPGLEHHDRCTFVAVKSESCQLLTSPPANTIREKWPENSLSYGAKLLGAGRRSLHKRALAKLKKLLS